MYNEKKYGVALQPQGLLPTTHRSFEKQTKKLVLNTQALIM